MSEALLNFKERSYLWPYIKLILDEISVSMHKSVQLVVRHCIFRNDANARHDNITLSAIIFEVDGRGTNVNI